jgi:low affinity Fe/Cu permease
MNSSVDNVSDRQPFRMALQSFFSRFAQRVARQTGRASSFALAVVFVVVWGVCGPFLGYSVSWQVTIDTICSIVTLLMVLLIQNTQNRDTQAIQMKLDELIQTSKSARNDLIEVEKLTEGEIHEVREIQREIREQSEMVKPEKI